MAVDWDALSEPYRLCLQEAWDAYRAGSLPIGAAVTDASGEILGSGRNRIFEPHAVDGAISGTRLAHAEMNALLAVRDSNSIDRSACVLYTTTEPCPLCIGAARMWGVKEIRYLQRDAVAGSLNLIEASPFMTLARFRAEWFGDLRLEALQMAMLMERHLDVAPLHPDLAQLWAESTPEGVMLAVQLRETGLLNDLSRTVTDARTAWSRIEPLLPADRVR